MAHGKVDFAPDQLTQGLRAGNQDPGGQGMLKGTIMEQSLSLIPPIVGGVMLGAGGGLDPPTVLGDVGVESWIENKASQEYRDHQWKKRRERHTENLRGERIYGGEKGRSKWRQEGERRKQMPGTSSLVSPPFLGYCPFCFSTIPFLSHASSSFRPAFCSCWSGLSQVLFLMPWNQALVSASFSASRGREREKA